MKTSLTSLALVALSLSACSLNNQVSAPSDTTNPAASTATQSEDLEMEQPMEQVPAAMKYTLQDLAKHANPPDDCWIAIEGKVYDVSGFAAAGHGGGEAVYQGCGTDATKLYQTRPMGSGTPHSDKANDLLPNFYIGDLVETPSQ